MLSKVGSYVLCKVLGDYIEGLEQNKLSFSIASGAVSLKDLTLKRSILKQISLPLDMKEGQIGEISLKLPWSKLSTEPAIVSIRDVFILLAPRNPTAEEERSVAYDNKCRKLRFAAMLGQDKPPTEEVNKPKEAEKKPGYFEGIVASIVNNLQIFIDNIHIRYEDNISSPQVPFSFGITLERAHMQSADENWKPTLSVGQKIMYKLLDVCNLSMYLNPTTSFLKYSSTSEFVREMKQLIQMRNGEKLGSKLDYMIVPISGQLRASVNSVKTDLSRPRTTVDFVVDVLDVSLLSTQYNSILGLTTWLSLYEKRIQAHKYSPPTIPPTENPKRWWTFAISAVLDNVRDKNQRWDWNFFQKFKTQRRLYIGLFKKFTQLGEAKMTPEDSRKFHELQQENDYETLLTWRKMAHSEMIKEQAKKKSQGWLGGWLGRSEISDSELEGGMHELYASIGYDEKQKPSDAPLPTDYVLTQVFYHSKGGSFKLKEGGGRESVGSTIIDMSFSDLKVKLDMRDSSTSMRASLQTFTASDYHTLAGKQLDMLVMDQTNLEDYEQSGEGVPMLSVNLDLKPLTMDVDVLLALSTRPVLITYSPPVVDRVVKFFTPENAEAVVMPTYDFSALREQTQSKLKYAMEAKSKIFVDLDIHSATLVLPSDITSKTAPSVVVGLDKIRLTSDLRDRVAAEKAAASSELSEEYFYDAYQLSIRNICTYISRDYKQWRQLLREGSDLIAPLIPPFDLNLTLKLRTVPVATIPQTILSGDIPALHVHVAKSRLRELLAVLKTLGSGKSSTAQSTPAIAANSRASLPSAKPPQVEAKNLRFDFTIKEICVVLRQTSESDSGEINNLPLIMVKLLDMGVYLESNTTDTTINAQLHGAFVQDLTAEDIYEKPRYLVVANPGSDSPLVAFNYRSFPPGSRLHQGSDSTVSLRIDEVECTVHRPTIAILLHTINDITQLLAAPPAPVEAQKTLSAPKKVVKPPATPNSNSLLSDVEDEGFESASEGDEDIWQEFTEEKVDITTSSMRVEIETKKIGITLLRDDEPFFVAALTDTKIEVDMKRCKQIIAGGHLGGVIAKDLYDTPWSDLVRIETSTNKKMVSFQYRTFLGDLPDYPGYNSLFSMDMATVHVVFLQSLITELSQYAAGLNELQSVLTASKKPLSDLAAPQAEISQSGDQALASRMKLSIHIANPHILVPVSRESKEHLLMDLGAISLENEFKTLPPNVVVDYSTIKITKLNITTRHEQGLLPLLTNTDIEVLLQRPTANNEQRTVPMEIITTIPNVSLAINDQQILHLLRVLNNNLGSMTRNDAKGDLDSLKRSGHLKKPSKKERKSKEVKEIVAPPNADLPAEICNIKFRLKLSTFGFTLAKALEKEAPDSKSQSPLISLHINSIQTRYHGYTNGKLWVGLSIREILLQDIRPHKKAYASHLLSIVSPLEDAIQVGFTSAPGEMKLKFEADALRILPVPETILSLLDFTENLSRNMAILQKSKTQETKPASTVTKESEVQKPTSLSIYVTMKSPQLIGLENYYQKLTTAFVFELGDFSFRYKTLPQADLWATLVKTKAIQYRLYDALADVKKTDVDIILPVNIEFGMKTGDEADEIKLGITKTQMIISYNEISSMMKLYGAWQGVLSYFAAKSTPEAIDDVVPVAPQKPEPAPLAKARNVNFDMSLLSFSLVDDRIHDTYSIPVLQAITKDLVATVKMTGLSMDLETKVDISVQSFNNALSTWEPVVEPCELNFTQKNNGTSSTVIVESKSPLNVNFTMSFLDTTFRALEFAQKDLAQMRIDSTDDTKAVTHEAPETDLASGKQGHPDGNRRDRWSHPLMISNQTGKDVMFWWTSDDREIEIVQSGRVKPILIDHNAKTEKNDKMFLSISLSEPGRKYKPIHHIAWSKVGTAIYSGIAPEKNSTERVVVEITQEGGSTIVTVRGDFFIQNQLDKTIQVQVIVKEKRELHHILHPGEKLGLPIELCRGDKTIMFRRSDRYDWWTWERSDMYVTCKQQNSATDTFPWVCAISQYQKINNGYVDYGLDLTAALVVDNRLPSRLKYKVHAIKKDKEKQTTSKAYSIEPTANVRGAQVTKLPSTDSSLGISIQIAGGVFSESEPIQLHALDFKQNHALHKFYVTDDSNGKLTLYLDVTKSADGASFNCVVYCPYWLINHTGLPLMYKANPSGKKLAPGQGNSGHDAGVAMHYGEGSPKNIFYYGKPEVSLSVPPYSAWSKAFTIALGNDGEINVLAKEEEYMFSVQVTTAPGKFWRTQIVRCYAKYTIVNCCPFPLRYKEPSSDDNSSTTIQPNTQLPLTRWSPSKFKECLILQPQEDPKGAETGENSWSDSIDVTMLRKFQVRKAQGPEVDKPSATTSKPKKKISSFFHINTSHSEPTLDDRPKSARRSAEIEAENDKLAKKTRNSLPVINLPLVTSEEASKPETEGRRSRRHSLTTTKPGAYETQDEKPAKSKKHKEIADKSTEDASTGAEAKKSSKDKKARKSHVKENENTRDGKGDKPKASKDEAKTKAGKKFESSEATISEAESPRKTPRTANDGEESLTPRREKHGEKSKLKLEKKPSKKTLKPKGEPAQVQEKKRHAVVEKSSKTKKGKKIIKKEEPEDLEQSMVTALMAEYLDVEVKLFKSLRYIIIDQARKPLFKICNFTDHTLCIRQDLEANFDLSINPIATASNVLAKGKASIQQLSSAEAPSMIEVAPGAEVPWFWEAPQQDLLQAKVTFKLGNFQSTPKRINFAEVKEFSSIKTGQGDYISLTLTIVPGESMNGTRKVHYITKVLTCKNISKQENATKKATAASMKAALPPALFTFQLKLSNLGFSVVDRRQELLFIYLENLKFESATSAVHHYVELLLAKFQIDNQLYLTPRRIVLFSPPATEQVLNISLIQDTRFAGASCYRYFGLGLQELHLAVDQIFLAHVLDYWNYLSDHLKTLSGKDETSSLIQLDEEPGDQKPARARKVPRDPTRHSKRSTDRGTTDKDKDKEKVQEVPKADSLTKIDESILASSQFVYIEALQLNAMVFYLTFTSAAPPPDSNIGTTALDQVMQIAGVVSDIEEAPIKIPGLFAENLANTQEQFTFKVYSHYKNYILSQVLVLLGSVDFIGDPVGLVSSLGTGVYSFFHEPAKGLVSSPKAFGLGVAKGTKALLSNSIQGVFSTASKLTSGVTKAATMLSMDKEYQHERTIMKHKKARHAGEGLAMGFRDFGTGFVKGVTGVVMQPVKGARKEGAIGALKGVGKGLAGVVLKPTIGTIDLVSRTAEGIAATPSFFDAKAEPIRLPRFFDQTGQLQVYDEHLAEGAYLVNTLDRGKFKSHTFVTKSETGLGSCVLITDKALFNLQRPVIDTDSRSTSPWKASWIVHLSHIQPHMDLSVEKGKLALEVYDENWNTVTKTISTDSHSVYREALQELMRTISKYAKMGLNFQKVLADQAEGEEGPAITTHKAGTLYNLRADAIPTAWRESVCTLENGVFSFQAVKEKSKSKEIVLRDKTKGVIFCFSDDRDDKDNTFLVVSEEQKTIFAANDLKDRQDWIDAFIENGAYTPHSVEQEAHIGVDSKFTKKKAHGFASTFKRHRAGATSKSSKTFKKLEFTMEAIPALVKQVRESKESAENVVTALVTKVVEQEEMLKKLIGSEGTTITQTQTTITSSTSAKSAEDS